VSTTVSHEMFASLVARADRAESRVADPEAAARALLDAMADWSKDSGQVWEAIQALRALVGDETPGTGEHDGD
jgi:hypothetical protein